MILFIRSLRKKDLWSNMESERLRGKKIKINPTLGQIIKRKKKNMMIRRR